MLNENEFIIMAADSLNRILQEACSDDLIDEDRLSNTIYELFTPEYDKTEAYRNHLGKLDRATLRANAERKKDFIGLYRFLKSDEALMDTT